MKRVSLRTMISNDSVAPVLFAGVWVTIGLFCPVAARLAGLLPLLHTRDGRIFEVHEEAAYAIFIVGAGMVLMAFLVWRISRVSRILNSGVRVKAKVTKAVHVRRGGRIDLEYALNDQIHKTASLVHSNPLFATYECGQTLEIVLDPDNPKRCLIHQLYFI